MADKRRPGPLGMPGDELPHAVALAMPPSRNLSSLSPLGAGDSLSDEERELLGRLAELSLRLVGISALPPIADGTNTALAIGRGEVTEANGSGLGIVPYLGDLAASGKLRSYSMSLEQAIALAMKNTRFASAARPLFEKLRHLLDGIPLEALGPVPRHWVNLLKLPLDDYLGHGAVAAKKSSEFEQLVDRLLIARLGSTLYVADFVRNNVAEAAALMLRNHLDENQILQVLSGIDLHSPVRATRLMPGDRLVQAVQRGKVGAWFVKAGGGVGPERVGIARGGRVNMHFKVIRSLDVVESIAGSVIDRWTQGSTSSLAGSMRAPGRSVVVDSRQGRLVESTAAIVQSRSSDFPSARGGGRQYFAPALYGHSDDRWKNYLEKFDQPKRK